MRLAQRFLTTLFSATLFLLGGMSSGTALAATTPTTDFTDNRDGTVSHKTTGLTWKRCAEGQTWSGSTCDGIAQAYTWDAAMALGSNGWGLPTLEQLKTIVETGHGSPTINQTVFPNTPEPASAFWSASAYAGNSGGAWNVGFDNGLDGASSKARPSYVRLVRGGQSVVGTSSPSAPTNGASTPVPTASGQGFSASATATGDITRQTLQGRVNVHPGDIGNPGAVFVVATTPGLGTFYHGANGSWLPNVQSYYRGALANMDVGIVENPMDLSALGDTKVYLGYGLCLPLATASRCYDDMNSNATVHLAHTVQFTGKLAITTYTQSSTNGTVSPLISVANNSGQQITYWGLKDKAGAPFALTEALFKDAASGDQISTIYGTHGLPRKFVNQKTGESATVQWGLSGGVFRLYDANGKITMGYGLAIDGSGKLVSTPLANNGQFAGDPDDIDISLVSPADLALAKKNQKDIGKGITAAGVIVCAYSGGALCPAGALIAGIGLATNAVANCDSDCGAGKINNLIPTLKDKGNKVMGWFSKGWKWATGNSNPAPGNDSDPGVPEIAENTPQYSTIDIPTVRQADPALVQALAKANPPISTNLPASPCPDGQFLSALSNLCEITPACPYGYVSDNKGYCIEPSMCTAPNVIQYGQCVSPTPTCNSATQTLKNGQCVNKLICDAYQKEVNGVCVADCTSAQDLVNGVCVAKCASGQTRQNGVCVNPQPTCYAPQIPQNGRCVTPQPVANGSITVSVEDACNDGYAVEYKFFDDANGITYQLHATSHENTVYTHTLSCVPGAKIAIGGQTGNKYWGVSLSNDKSCSGCGYTCDGRTYQTYRFGCSTGSTSNPPSSSTGNDPSLIGTWKMNGYNQTYTYDGTYETIVNSNGCIAKASYSTANGMLTTVPVSYNCVGNFNGGTYPYRISGNTLYFNNGVTSATRR